MDASIGADALCVDHGYYNYATIPAFHSNKFLATYAKYKRMVLMADGGGELASEQMAELA